MGGKDGKNRDIALVERYDTMSNDWRAIVDMPQALHDACIAILNDTLYVIGGCYKEYNFSKVSKCIYEYDFASEKWSCSKYLSVERGGASQ